jgi:hypothetical protein
MEPRHGDARLGPRGRGRRADAPRWAVVGHPRRRHPRHDDGRWCALSART